MSAIDCRHIASVESIGCLKSRRINFLKELHLHIQLIDHTNDGKGCWSYKYDLAETGISSDSYDSRIHESRTSLGHTFILD